MPETYVQLPDTAANTGPKIRGRTRVITGNTIVEHVHQTVDRDNDTIQRVLTTDPAATDAGAVVRNIPSGTQNVAQFRPDGRAAAVDLRDTNLRLDQMIDQLAELLELLRAIAR